MSQFTEDIVIFIYYYFHQFYCKALALKYIENVILHNTDRNL